ncbi:MAG: hypothetical protein AVDCRST_MAG38-560, partial [uncultured Solirubrobacteraceae bacterium]
TSLPAPRRAPEGVAARGRVASRGLEATGERRAHARDGLSAEQGAAGGGRTTAVATADRRPAGRGAGLHPLDAALGLHSRAGAAEQPLADPRPSGASPPLPRREHQVEVGGDGDEGDRPRRGAARVPAVGPRAASRADPERQAPPGQQDAQRRLHRRSHQGVLAGFALHLPAAPPGGDRPLAAEPAAGIRRQRRDHPALRRRARARSPGASGPDRPLRGRDDRPGGPDAPHLRVPRRSVGGRHDRLRASRSRPLQGRPRRLGGQDPDRPDPAGRAAAARARDSRGAARAVRRLGLPAGRRRGGTGGAGRLVSGLL